MTPNKNEAFDILAKICTILDLKSEVNASDEKGEKPLSFEGRIEFKNVYFAYPAH